MITLFANASENATELALFWWVGIIGTVGFIMVWNGVALRLSHRQPVLPYASRRPVPWRGIHVLIILLVYLMAPIMAMVASDWLFGTEIIEASRRDESEAATRIAATAEETLSDDKEGLAKPSTDIRTDPKPTDDSKSTDHMIQKLLRSGGALGVIVCFLSAAIVAPIVEEFLFRLVIQGWLEAVESRWQDLLLRAGRSVPWILRSGALPIVMVSGPFAMMHYRGASEAEEPTYYVSLFVAGMVANTVAIVFGYLLLRYTAGATLVDLGWVTKEFGADLRLGLFTFMAIAIPVYALMFVAQSLLPKTIAADPIPLFFFSVVLGLLYARTHRVVPSIVLHMALNTTSLTLAWLALS